MDELLPSNRQAYSEYMDDMNNSEGFFVTKSDDGSVLLGGVRPVDDISDPHYHKATIAAKYAVDEHNKNININNININGEKKEYLKFVKIVNLNREPTAGATYYVTMEVEDSSGEINIYQAKIWDKITSGRKVQIFRPAPYYAKSSGMDYGYEEIDGKDYICIWMKNLEPWMDENYLYYKCFNRARPKILSTKVIRLEKTSYGVVCFKSMKAADETLKIYNGKKMPHSNQSYQLDWEIFP